MKLYGLRAGTVTGTELQLDLPTGGPRVRLQSTFSQRILPGQQIPATNPLDDTVSWSHLNARPDRYQQSDDRPGRHRVGHVPDAPPAEAHTEATVTSRSKPVGRLAGTNRHPR